MNTEDKRIPIDQFMSYPDARLVGGNPANGTGSIRWQAMMEALDAGRAERQGLPVSPEPMGEQTAIKGREPYGAPNVADVYTVTPGLVPSGAVGPSEVRWYAPLSLRVAIAPQITRHDASEANNG